MQGKFWVAFRALRVHQWAKNLLIFVPMLAAHRFLDLTSWFSASVACLAFSWMASAVYLLNDLMDLSVDRQHARKHARPLAAGDLSIRTALAWIIALTGASLSLATWLLPLSFVAILSMYAFTTFCYSIYLKKIPLVDVTCLAMLYIARTIAGHEATGTPYSPWLLAFCLFLFFSLALVKRFSELRGLEGDASLGVPNPTIPGRGYMAQDRAIVSQLGVSSGLIAILVFALYMDSQAVLTLYPRAGFLWGITPLLTYWVSRIWFLANRNQLDDDPVLFALRDRTSYVLGLGVAIFIFLASAWSGG